MKTYQNYTIFTFILGILVLFASYIATLSTILPIIGLIYVVSVAYCLGELFFGCQEIMEKIILGLMSEVFVIVIIGSIFFYLYKLNSLFFVFITLGFPILIFFLQCKNKSADERCPTPNRVSDTQMSEKSDFQIGNRISIRATTFLVLICVYLISTATLFYILISHSTLLPIRTSWEVLPKYFFAIFFINSLTLITILLNKKKLKIVNYKLILISIYLFLFFSIAYFIYKLGYGFDPFIHRVALDVILKTGTITPKPFYYIGEYSLLFYLSKLLEVNITILEKILVPLFAAILLPATLCHYLSKKFQCSEFNWLVIISLLLIPAGFLIVTTPQNLANLFLIVLIIFTLNSSREEKMSTIFLILNALAIFCIHPISGIPAFLFLILFFLWRKANLNYETNNQKKIQNTKYKILNTKIYIRLFFILACFGLITFPVLWLINSAISPQTAITINSKILSRFTLYLQNLKLLSFGNLEQFKIILNIIYFFYFNLPIILTLVFIFGFKKSYQEKKNKEYAPYLISFLILFFNYFILKTFINFGFLINYERDNYTNRVLEIAYLFLIPFLLIFINSFWEKIKLKNFNIKYIFIIILPICLCASLYFTYPRHDNFTASHGYNTSKYDIMAVNYIDKNSNGDFIVLANQQVSAAALQEFGFKKYYDTKKGKLFYYPVPTGDALYQYYLEMVNKKPTRETMENAMKMAGVRESYFVINKYWWQSGQIIELAKPAADKYVVIENEVYVFKFVASNNTN